MNSEEIQAAVDRALAEDIGEGDVTAKAIVPSGTRARALITQKAPGVLYGFDAVEYAFRRLEPGVEVVRMAPEAEWREPGPVMQIDGAARVLLAGERTALNFLARLSGVATLTALCVAAVEGTGVRILDTRKTTPGLRFLEKAAVRAGGGHNHRRGLDDAILIKENHAALAGGVGEAVRRARAAAPNVAMEVECRSPGEIEEALEAGAERLLLDNMSSAELVAAVAQVAGRAVLEASGGMSLENLPAHAATGVEFISVGALTHSAPALDLTLTLEPLP